MKYLLIGGAQSVGKTGSISRLLKELLSFEGFETENDIPEKGDFKVILLGRNKEGKEIRILINTATDNESIIWGLKKFLDKHAPVDIIISSIRDNGFYPRKQFFEIMELDPQSSEIIEIPLAKITRRGDNFDVAWDWYEDKTIDLMLHILGYNPFNFSLIKKTLKE